MIDTSIEEIKRKLILHSYVGRYLLVETRTEPDNLSELWLFADISVEDLEKYPSFFSWETEHNTNLLVKANPRGSGWTCLKLLAHELDRLCKEARKDD